MKTIEIYTKSWCPYCHRAKALLDEKGVDYREIDVTHDDVREAEMRRRSSRDTVPQIFVDGLHVGGYDDLAALHAHDELDRLLDYATPTDPALARVG